MKRVLLFACVMALAGCKVTATMIPVEGPLSQLSPVPMISVRADGVMGNTGKLTFVLPGAVSCSGRWSSAAGTGMTFGSASLLGQYGPTYVNGFSVSSGSGQNPGQALATCEDGTTFQLEFVTGAGTTHGYGIAKDSKQNIYRYVF